MTTLLKNPPQSGKMRRFLLNLGLILISLALGLLLAEGIIRLMFPQPQSLVVYDRWIHYRYRSNLDRIIKTNEFTANIRTNSLGWIGAEFTPDRPHGGWRMVNIGDSITSAEQVDTDKTFSSLMQNQLTAVTSAPLVEVLNLGVSGRGTAEELLTYEHYGRRYQPDLVGLWFFVGNDLANNYAMRDSLSQREYVNQNGALKEFAHRFQIVRVVFNAGKHSVFFLQLLNKWGLLQQRYDERNYNYKGLPLDAIITFGALASPEQDEADRVTAELLRRFKFAVGSVPFVIFIIPAAEQVSDDAAKAWLGRYPAILTPVDFAAPTARVLKLCASLDLRCFNLTPALRAATESSEELLYFVNLGDHPKPAISDQFKTGQR